MNKRPFIDLFIENTITLCFLSAETKGAFRDGVDQRVAGSGVGGRGDI